MFPCSETAYSNAGDGQERDEVASEEHGPGSPRVVRQQDQYTGHQVEVSNYSLQFLNKTKTPKVTLLKTRGRGEAWK